MDVTFIVFKVVIFLVSLRRGASIYRGVTRSVSVGLLDSIEYIDQYIVLQMVVDVVTDTISMADGKRGLEEWRATRTFTLEPSVSSTAAARLGTQEEAAEAYDIAAIKFRGLNAVTNFDMSRYDINSIVNNDLPIGGLSGRPSKASESSPSSSSDCMSVDMKHQLHRQAPSASLGLATIPMTQDHDYWSLLALHHQASGFGLFSASGGTMDFATAAAPSSKRMLEHQQEQSQSSSCSPVPYATCVACGGGHSDEGSNIMGGLAAPPSSYQQQPVSKPHVAAFQSAIFGME
ncbi:hypothetical protein BHM03_00043914 [Ensete ventricosum]|nr:hypothetical protein BHM03_00043914 [Ensete ventricosum]